jgi:acetolactate synthase-1/2/3 large subunit
MVVGTPFDFRLGFGKALGPFGKPGPNAKVIQVDLDEAELGHNRSIDIGITGDAAAVFSQLAAAVTKVPAARSQPWLDHLRGVEQKAEEHELPLRNSDAVPIHPLAARQGDQRFSDRRHDRDCRWRRRGEFGRRRH